MLVSWLLPENVLLGIFWQLLGSEAINIEGWKFNWKCLITIQEKVRSFSSISSFKWVVIEENWQGGRSAPPPSCRSGLKWLKKLFQANLLNIQVSTFFTKTKGISTLVTVWSLSFVGKTVLNKKQKLQKVPFWQMAYYTLIKIKIKALCGQPF